MDVQSKQLPYVHDTSRRLDATAASVLHAIRRASEITELIAIGRVVDALCEETARSRARSDGDSNITVCRCASLAAACLRRARAVHHKLQQGSSGTLSAAMEELAFALHRSVRKMTCIRCDSLEDSSLLTALFDAEFAVVQSATSERVLDSMERLADPRLPTWDMDALLHVVRSSPSPVDIENPRRYCVAVEEGVGSTGVDGNPHAVVEDVSPSVVVSAKDPLSLVTIRVPVRGTTCRHLQCFDLKNFLAVLFRASRTDAVPSTEAVARPMKRKRWMCSAPCPVCAHPLAAAELYVDRLQAAILAGANYSDALQSIRIDRRTAMMQAVLSEVPQCPTVVADTHDARVPSNAVAKPRREGFVVEGVHVAWDDAP